MISMETERMIYWLLGIFFLLNPSWGRVMRLQGLFLITKMVMSRKVVQFQMFG